MKQHPTAIIDAKAEIDDDVTVGPYTIIEGPVRIGSGTRIMAHAHISGNTQMGCDNEVHIGAVIGHLPQHLSYEGCKSGTVIGDRNVFREYVTVHRSWEEGGKTKIGNDNFLMGLSHIAHDCIVGNKVIIANGALLGGHVEIEDRAFLSGNAMFHQFVRVGAIAMVSGGAAVTKDVPPYCTAVGRTSVVGINVIGLRRAGISAESRKQIQEAFKIFFRSGLNAKNALKKIEFLEECEEVAKFVEFIKNSKRGICSAYLKDNGQPAE